MLTPKYFDFDHVRLLPRKGIVNSRDECNAQVTLGKHTFKLGVIPANMLCTIDANLCKQLAMNGYFYIHHRFRHDNIKFIEQMNNDQLLTSISVGVNLESFKLIREIKNRQLKVDVICVDTAHGHCEALERTVKMIKDTLPDVFVIGGNICTSDAVTDLESWGCDATKAGIGPGLACTTYHSTNVGSRDWQASMIMQLRDAASKPIICDGGIRTVGHICASFVMGATMTMVGSLLSGFLDSPGDEVVGFDGKKYKEFFGSASEYTKGHRRYAEGTKVLMEPKAHTLLDFLENEVTHGIHSAISYLGGNDMKAFDAAEFIIVK